MGRRSVGCLIALVSLASLTGCLADSYLNNPRGSNNKLSEQSNNVQNDKRLFDSQNNAASGYQIGDNCKPVCQNGNQQYAQEQPGAMQGIMKYYQGSELYIEWYHQHGCGVGHPNVRCQIILQYMSEADNPGIRDGTKRGNQNTAGGQQEPPTAEDAAAAELGQHEPLDFYLDCKKRERNKGLYTSDQQMNNARGATATRQNNNGNNNANDRHGLECPEERDYYPYWHPSPWHDIAVLTDEPQTRCGYYQEESQNVRAKGYCSDSTINNPKACTDAGKEWKEKAAWNEPPPECIGAIASRDNHNGNVRNGSPVYYVWNIPDFLKGRAVLRLRYNITTGDFNPTGLVNQDPAEAGASPAAAKRDIGDPFFIDAKFNDKDPNTRRRTIFQGGPPIIANDPAADWIKLGAIQAKNRVLQLQINTNQLPRTFEDRTHTFMVEPRPSNVGGSARIVNYNVRGRRGNIVQTYPSVEYDFVPPELSVDQGTYLHFQWAGSDANQNGNAGNGRDGTDRSNIVQVAARGENVPLTLDRHTLFTDGSDTSDAEGRALVDKFAWLDQDANVKCNPDETNNNAVENCKQLNGASAYFNGGLVEMKQIGTHHIVSTRNNDFSNRSQKATITVTMKSWEWYSILAATVGGALVLASAGYLGTAIYAYRRPNSELFSKRYRPRVLNWVVPKTALKAKIDERKQWKTDQREKKVGLRDEAAQHIVGKAHEDANLGANGNFADKTPPPKTSWTGCMAGCRSVGLGEQRVVDIVYTVLNLFVFMIGFLSHLGMGFHASLAYPLAKGAGFTLDLNLAMVVLPTLKSLQTALRGAGSTREWIPIDDPIAFHIRVATFILAGTVVHVGAHMWHMTLIKTAPTIQHDPLGLWDLSEQELVSGATILEQFLNWRSRCAALTGVVVTVLVVAMAITAMPCSRRGTNRLTRCLGGYNLFWRVHAYWKWVFVLLLLHAPGRLWIWLFFPAMLVVLDRILLANRQRPYLVLLSAKTLPKDVMMLTFEMPQGWSYEAGQYVLIGWQGEWHPFTLTSAPEEKYLSVHIRAPSSLDWCSALRRRLLVDAPADAEEPKPMPGMVALSSTQVAPVEGDKSPKHERKQRPEVHYTACVCPRSHVVYCRPLRTGLSDVEAAAQAVNKKRKPEVASPGTPNAATGGPSDLERGPSVRSFETVAPSQVDKVLPKDAVVLQISGPFGAPAQKVWNFETIMCVGAGIGVTPFASILKSAQSKVRQRKAIEGLMGAPSPTNIAKKKGKESRHSEKLNSSLGTRESLDQLLREVVTVPRQIYFYWIVRSQDELDWFYDLLAAAVEGPARDNVHISVFLTGEIELKQVRELKCTQSQYFGRPNWGRIFSQVKKEHGGEHIGVFLCGSPIIGKELSYQSTKHTDPLTTEGGTRFSFFKEHF